MFKMLREASVKEVEIEITDEDQKKWLRAIKAEAGATDRKINAKKGFEDVAFDVLDKEPKFQHISNGEIAKLDIIDELFDVYKSEKKMSTSKPNGKKYDSLLVNKKQKAEEENEDIKPIFKKSDHINGNVLTAAGSKQPLKAVVDSAYKAGCGCNCLDSAKKVKNPYSTGSARHNLWQKSFERGLIKGLGGAVEAEDEERELDNSGIPGDDDQYQPSIDDVPDSFDDLDDEDEDLDPEGFNLGDEDDEFDDLSADEFDSHVDDYDDEFDDDDFDDEDDDQVEPIEQAGYIACIQIHSVADEQVDLVNPFVDGSPEAEMYQAGWDRGLAELGFEPEEMDEFDISDEDTREMNVR